MGERLMAKKGIYNNQVSSTIQTIGKDAFFCYSFFDEKNQNADVCLTREIFSIDEFQNDVESVVTDVRISMTSVRNEDDEEADRVNRVKLSFEEIKEIALFLSEIKDIGIESEIPVVEYVVQKYFNVLVQLFEGANQVVKNSPYLFCGYKRILEEFLFMNSYRLKEDNSYILSSTHPIVLMNKWCEKKNSDLLSNFRDESTEKNIIKTILDTKNRNRRHFKIYTSNKVLEVGKELDNFSNYYKAEGFGNGESNITIPAIRLWEKIQNYRKNHNMPQGTIRIACFGRVENVEQLKKLCGSDEKNIEVEFFKRNAAIGAYYFVNSKDACGKEVYDLLNTSDVDSLFEKYQIVLFMDMNCFYRQYQCEKSIDEKNEVANCKWYLDRANQFKDFKDKAIAYQLIYNHIGMWLNSYHTEKSATYEFDEKLYLSLLTAYKPQTDVYIYIKYGNKIGGNSLRYSNVCNDEYYDGSELIVYKFGREIDISQKCLEFSTRKINVCTRINFWKILKSINNQYCEDVLRELAGSDQDTDIVKMISCCKETYVVLDYSNMISDNLKEIVYCIQTKDKTGLVEAKCKEIMMVVIKHALGMGGITCIRRFFRKLITNSIISNAEDISDLLFAHLIEKGELDGINFVEGIIKQEDENNLGNAEFKVKRTFYSVITKLADLRIRSIEDRKGYFMYTVRKEVCPQITEDVFGEMLAGVAKCCEKFEYTGSLLYSNSTLE